MSLKLESFSDRLLRWYKTHGRHDLPWQHPIHPYRVWVSEIMLQQTQVNTVIPYFEKFMTQFPDVNKLSSSPLDDVLARWSGLGYYARAKNLHKAARIVQHQHQGIVPDNFEALIALPGIGRSTANAILSLAYHQPTAICDGNVKRVLSRWLALKQPINIALGENHLWQQAQKLQSQQQPAQYTQAIMDLGATVCTRTKPKCGECPVNQDCQALKSNKIVTDWPIKQKRPKRTSIEVNLYLIFQNNHLWLEKPDSAGGIWADLYQLPQKISATLENQPKMQLDLFIHELTHRIMRITPYVIQLENESSIDLSLDGLWYNFAYDQIIARPVVVDKLLSLCQKKGIIDVKS